MQVNYGTLCPAMVEIVNHTIQAVPMSFVAGSSGNLLEWAEYTIASKDNLRKLVHKVTGQACKEYERAACNAYDAAFASNQKLSRFPTLQTQVKANIPNRIQEALNAAKPAIAVMMTTAEQHLYDGTLSQQDLVQRFHQLKHSMGRCIVEHMVKFLKHSPLSLPPDFQLIEDDRTASDRRSLQKQMDRVNQAIVQLDEMKSESFLEHGAAGFDTTGIVNPLQHLESAPIVAVADSQDTPRADSQGNHSVVPEQTAVTHSQNNHSVDPDLYTDLPTAAAVQPAGDYADSLTAMDVQRREADPLPVSAGHWQNGPHYVADSTGKLLIERTAAHNADLLECI